MAKFSRTGIERCGWQEFKMTFFLCGKILANRNRTGDRWISAHYSTVHRSTNGAIARKPRNFTRWTLALTNAKSNSNMLIVTTPPRHKSYQTKKHTNRNTARSTTDLTPSNNSQKSPCTSSIYNHITISDPGSSSFAHSDSTNR